MQNDIRHISEEELKEFLIQNNEKAFRIKQINEWLWKKGAHSFEAMHNLPKSLLQKLSENLEFKVTDIDVEVRSHDLTTKFLFRLHDGQKVEGVLIPTETRVTACISSQVGCPLGCAFCATGKMGFIRNLHYTEIFDQFVLMNQKSEEYFGRRISNIVYMGMGEPLLNYDNVMRSIHLLTSPDGQGMSPARITLSTVGVTEGIRRLADDGFPCGLALSLHCADEAKRLKIIPSTKTFTLKKISEALQYFHQKTKERISIEYLLIANENDTLEDAEKLWDFCRPFPVKINLIEYNDNKLSFQKSTAKQMEKFVNFLETKNMVVTVRHSRGQDIEAACGQLLVKEKSKKA